MPTQRCPQCSATVSADERHCHQCGYPLAWRSQDTEDDTAPVDDMARRPDEVVGDAGPSEQRQRTLIDGWPAPPDDIGPADPPTIACRSCGADVAAERTTCPWCGGDPHALPAATGRGGAAWWSRLRLPRPRLPGWSRGARWALVAVVVLGLSGAAALLYLRDRGAAADAGGRARIVLQEGDTGAQVTRWQQLLTAAGVAVRADGTFGPETTQATQRFQVAIGEEPTGRVSTATVATAGRADALRQVQVVLVRDGALAAAPRLVDQGDLLGGTMRVLLTAPLGPERANGLRTAIPAGTTLERADLDGGAAVVRLSGFAAEPSRGRLQARVAQVARTLGQFDAVATVQIVLPDAERQVFDQAGVGLTVAVRRG